jgi:hypothetical protein
MKRCFGISSFAEKHPAFPEGIHYSYTEPNYAVFYTINREFEILEKGSNVSETVAVSRPFIKSSLHPGCLRDG